jgi:hypothetical protein
VLSLALAGCGAAGLKKSPIVVPHDVALKPGATRAKPAHHALVDRLRRQREYFGW